MGPSSKLDDVDDDTGGSSGGAPIVPLPLSEVDADLHHIEDPIVRTRVMLRRREEARKRAEAVEAVEEADRMRQAQIEAQQDSHARLGEMVKKWAKDDHGKDKQIRILLATLPSVLWEDAKSKWKPASMAELIDPNKVKLAYMKAIRLVHPDKIAADAPADDKFIASAVFDALNGSFTAFNDEGAK